MKLRINPLWLFLLVAAVQLLVPAGMIYQQESTLTQGAVYRFKTAPVDPYDPFRGRFVALNVEANQAPTATSEGLKRGDWAYVLLGTDGQGFATLQFAYRQPPATGDYLRLKVRAVSGDSAQLALPFSRYYAEESIAPEIERAYRSSSRRGQQNAFIQVRVMDGRGVIEELYVANLPIMEFLAQEAKAPRP